MLLYKYNMYNFTSNTVHWYDLRYYAVGFKLILIIA